jgi:hypothetical protein
MHTGFRVRLPPGRMAFWFSGSHLVNRSVSSLVARKKFILIHHPSSTTLCAYEEASNGMRAVRIGFEWE